jgi:hypothetical protein
MSDEGSVVQFSGRDSISYVDNGTVLFNKAVLAGKSLSLQDYFLNKSGILFPVCRVDPLQIKISAVIHKFAFPDAKQFTQIGTDVVQMNRSCQYILMEAADLMSKYFLHIV